MEIQYAFFCPACHECLLLGTMAEVRDRLAGPHTGPVGDSFHPLLKDIFPVEKIQAILDHTCRHLGDDVLMIETYHLPPLVDTMPRVIDGQHPCDPNVWPLNFLYDAQPTDIWREQFGGGQRARMTAGNAERFDFPFYVLTVGPNGPGWGATVQVGGTVPEAEQAEPIYISGALGSENEAKAVTAEIARNHWNENAHSTELGTAYVRGELVEPGGVFRVPAPAPRASEDISAEIRQALPTLVEGKAALPESFAHPLAFLDMDGSPWFPFADNMQHARMTAGNADDPDWPFYILTVEQTPELDIDSSEWIATVQVGYDIELAELARPIAKQHGSPSEAEAKTAAEAFARAHWAKYAWVHFLQQKFDEAGLRTPGEVATFVNRPVEEIDPIFADMRASGIQ